MSFKKPGLAERIARKIIKEQDYSITHLEGGGAHGLYKISRGIVLKRMKTLSCSVLGRIVGSHTADHAEVLRSETSLLEVHCNEDSPFGVDNGGQKYLQKLATMVIVAKMTDIITEDYVNDQAETLRIHLNSH